MLVEELSSWKCVYCDTVNDHTNHRCFNCNKKKPKLSTLKRILSRRKKEAKKQLLEVKTEQIKKLEPIPEVTDVQFNFDFSKLKQD